MAIQGYSGLALVLLDSLRRWLRAGLYSMSTANTNIDVHNGRLYALMESALPYQLALTPDGCGVQAVGQLHVPGYKGSFSAHPVAHSNGNWYSVSYTPQGSHAAQVVVLDEDARLVRLVLLTLGGRRPMIHDAAVTARYVVILDFPLLFTPEEMLKAGGSVVRSHSDKVARIGLMPVDAAHEDEVRWYSVPSAVFFHALNAYDTPDGDVVLHLCEKDNFDLRNAFDFDPTARLARYTLHEDGTVDQIVEDLGLDATFGARTFVDFPFVAKHMVGRCASIAWFTVFTEGTDGGSRNAGVCKYDLQKCKVLGTTRFEGDGIGEAALALRGEPRSEDDGYLCVPVRNAETQRTALHIYDARELSGEPLARVLVPDGFHVPSGFHSEWLPAETLAKL